MEKKRTKENKKKVVSVTNIVSQLIPFFSNKFVKAEVQLNYWFDIYNVYQLNSFLDMEVCDCSNDLLLFWTPSKDIQIFPEGDNSEGEIFK